MRNFFPKKRTLIQQDLGITNSSQSDQDILSHSHVPYVSCALDSHNIINAYLIVTQQPLEFKFFTHVLTQIDSSQCPTIWWKVVTPVEGIFCLLTVGIF